MSFFKKMLAKVGIGNIEVDSRLHTEQFIPGEAVEGVVYAKGGSVEQKVDQLYFALMTRYVKPEERIHNGHREIEYVHETVTIANFVLGESLVFAPGEEIEIPFHFILPHDVPISIGQSEIWIHTGMDVDNAIDPTDTDHVEILPHPYTSTIFEALGTLGFRIQEAENEYYPHRDHHVPFVQKFDFVPTLRSPYHASVEELEFVFFPNEHGIEMMMEFDRKARGLSGLFAELQDTDETCGHLSFGQEELEEGSDAIAERLAEVFDRLLEG
ncbi:sporulation protein [Paenibacillus hexagrammi]|uniref:Sporulation protein n=1 Tax=Paenibacillus hexagrammi TaxID=2908839 RepID=A0ABY3SHJ0_9BACL|nr:sporulation protein [Paenibacillus sp. YPD9-1]UJF32953.1 sporulation protein [Paenibacillus sp. YPD9-1]